MTNATEMYEGVLLEVDQRSSANFDVQDFNYFMGQAVEDVLQPELDAFELTQKVTDGLRPLVKVSEPIPVNADSSTDVRKLTVPEDYRHIVSCLLTLRQKVASTAFAVGALRKEYTKRLTGDSMAHVFDNSYLRPLVSDPDLRLYHRIIGNDVQLYFDTPKYPNSAVNIADATLEYVSTAPAIILNDDLSIDSDTVFPEHMNRKFVKRCAKLFLENEESARLPSYDAVNT